MFDLQPYCHPSYRWYRTWCGWYDTLPSSIWIISLVVAKSGSLGEVLQRQPLFLYPTDRINHNWKLFRCWVINQKLRSTICSILFSWFFQRQIQLYLYHIIFDCRHLSRPLLQHSFIYQCIQELWLYHWWKLRPLILKSIVFWNLLDYSFLFKTHIR